MIVHRYSARPFVAVEILAVTCIRRESEPSEILDPAQRTECRRGLLELVAVVSPVESVGPESAPLHTCLKIEESRLVGIVGHSQIAVGITEIGVVDVTVAPSQRTCREYRKFVVSDCSRKVGVEVTVLSAFEIQPQICRVERLCADIHCSGVGSDARNAVYEFDAGYAVHIYRQRVGLMSGAGIREIDAVEHHHSLVERPSANRNVGLRPLAAAFPDVYRRADAQCLFQSRKWCGGIGDTVEYTGLRKNTARGTLFCPDNLHVIDSGVAEYEDRVGLRRSFFCRQQDD